MKGDKTQDLGRIIKRGRRRSVAVLQANEQLRDALLHSEQECRELRDANANLVIERDAADGLVREIQEGKQL